MREIMFRGKRVDNNEWVYGYYVNCVHPDINGHDTHHFIVTYPGHEEDYHEVYTSTVGQYIDITDKDQTKIFDGDILKICNDYIGDENPFNVVVKFQKGAYVCRHIGEPGIYNHFSNWNVPYVWWEVIGNIHDNPELLIGE